MTDESRELNERDLELVVGSGDGGPIIAGDHNGAVEPNSKATPVLL